MAENNVKKVVTTSWDDGNIADLRVLELLAKYRLKGTFYIPRNFRIRNLTDHQVKLISQTQEIGAHTLDHVVLKSISEIKAEEQISGSKKYLEDLLGKPIEIFCYPGGFFNNKIKEIVKKSGFIGARTIKRFNLDFSEDNFELATTISVSSLNQQKNNKLFSALFYLLRGAQDFPRLINFKSKTRLSFKEFGSWKKIAIKSFDYVRKNGGVFHLWGHSHLIEQYNLWSEFEEVLDYIHGQDDVLYLTNSDLLKR